MDDNIQSESTELVQLVTFNIGEEEFAVDILNIHSINRMVEITNIPNAPDYVTGVINIRGQIIPIISLRKKLKFERIEYSKDTRFIVVEIKNKVFGFVVDRVNEVLRIEKKLLEPPPKIVKSISTENISAIAKLEDRIIILLDLDNLFSDDEINDIDNLLEQ